LVQRACAGDADAFGQLYDSYLDRIYRYIYFRITDEATAEDLTSKVFLKAWENLNHYKPTSTPFIGWLYTIAHNAVIDHYRTHRPTTDLDEVVELRASEPLPDEQVESKLEGETLRRALQRLTQPQRDVVSMKLLQGLSTDEIAKFVGKSAGAVRALQMRALQTLAKIYEEEDAGFVKAQTGD
jgi:RNA polymerase sigma-70 factor (ECF subfamily)